MLTHACPTLCSAVAPSRAEGFLASYFAASRTRWSELPRTYNLFQCPAADEVLSAHVWHLNPNFHAAWRHPRVREVVGALDARVDAVLRAG